MESKISVLAHLPRAGKQTDVPAKNQPRAAKLISLHIPPGDDLILGEPLANETRFHVKLALCYTIHSFPEQNGSSFITGLICRLSF